MSWDGKGHVSVSTPEEMRNKTCGICGNNNGDRLDDWIMGDSTVCSAYADVTVPGEHVGESMMYISSILVSG